LRRYLIFVAFIAITTALAGAIWKAHQFHRRLAALENPRWEQTLAAEHVYQRPVVAFGDSEISGWPMATSFGVLPIINRGVAGDEVLKSRERFARQVLPLNPSVVVILIGTNDLAHGEPPAAIVATIRDMADSVRSLGASLVLCSLLPARGEAAQVRPRPNIESVNSALQQLAHEEGAVYVDLYSAVIDSQGAFAAEFSDDGLHPNAAGYVRMTKTLLPVLLSSFAQGQLDQARSGRASPEALVSSQPSS
jgi:lysophospholipase L1-like esterase